MLLLSLAIAIVPAKPQVTTGAIFGYVYGPSEAPLSHASITVTDARHSTVRTATTNSEGAYVISGLNPAVYNVKATAANFTQISETGLALTVDTEKRIDFHLVIAGQKHTIEVIETAQPIQRDSGAVGTVLTQAR